jgi:hypothetical protein
MLRQAELQLTVTLSKMRNCNHENTLNASSFLIVWKLTDSSSGTDFFGTGSETGFELAAFGTQLRILQESRYIASAPTAQKIQPLLLERVYRIIA